MWQLKKQEGRAYSLVVKVSAFDLHPYYAAQKYLVSVVKCYH